MVYDEDKCRYEEEKRLQRKGDYNMSYEYYYSTPIMSYVNYALVLGIAVFVALVLGVVLFFTFFNKKHEGKYKGWKEKIYNFMNFNRFHAEDILRFLYIIGTCLFTIVGIVTIILGAFMTGILELIVANIVLRVTFELLMMFIILCRKAVSIDKKIDQITAFYQDDFDAYCGAAGEDTVYDSCGSCEFGCEETCAAAAPGAEEADRTAEFAFSADKAEEKSAEEVAERTEPSEGKDEKEEKEKNETF